MEIGRHDGLVHQLRLTIIVSLVGGQKPNIPIPASSCVILIKLCISDLTFGNWRSISCRLNPRVVIRLVRPLSSTAIALVVSICLVLVIGGIAEMATMDRKNLWSVLGNGFVTLVLWSLAAIIFENAVPWAIDYSATPPVQPSTTHSPTSSMSGMKRPSSNPMKNPAPSGSRSPYARQPSASKFEDQWDVFICHASEDKEAVARPIANLLAKEGPSVWYDEFTLRLGDSLRRSINRGISQSRYGVVILSPAFFRKEWSQRELDGLVSREISSGKVILPVWHNVERSDVERFSPVLADRLGITAKKGLHIVVGEILRVVHPGR